MERKKKEFSKLEKSIQIFPLFLVKSSLLFLNGKKCVFPDQEE